VGPHRHDTTRRHATRAFLVALACVALVALTGCNPFGKAGAETPTSYATATLTSEGRDVYRVSSTGNDVVFGAPGSNAGIGTRLAFRPSRQRPARDAEVCETWSRQDGTTNAGGVTQEGVALRIANNGPNHALRAVTVTKNIYLGWVWIFNVHVWDTSNTAQPYTQIASEDLSHVVLGAQLHRLPWRICARVKGTTLQFVTWLAGSPRPSYRDPVAAKTVKLPSSYDYAGGYGGYVGHLQPGHTVTFSDITTKP
jgi:hypothetical protein